MVRFCPFCSHRLEPHNRDSGDGVCICCDTVFEVSSSTHEFLCPCGKCGRRRLDVMTRNLSGSYLSLCGPCGRKLKATVLVDL